MSVQFQIHFKPPTRICTFEAVSLDALTALTKSPCVSNLVEALVTDITLNETYTAREAQGKMEGR